MIPSTVGRPVPLSVWLLVVATRAGTDPQLRKRLPVLLDIMTDANDDGSGALRRVEDTRAALRSAGLPDAVATVKRHRQWAIVAGYVQVVEAGRGPGIATIFRATLPDWTPPEQGSTPGRDVIPESSVSGDMIPVPGKGITRGSNRDHKGISPRPADDPPHVPSPIPKDFPRSPLGNTTPNSSTQPAETTARTLTDDWIDTCTSRPPARVIGQVAQQLKQMLTDGQRVELIRQGLESWAGKGLHPSALPSEVYAMQAKGQQRKSQDHFPWSLPTCPEGLDPDTREYRVWELAMFTQRDRDRGVPDSRINPDWLAAAAEWELHGAEWTTAS